MALFDLFFDVATSVLLIGLTAPIARLTTRLFPVPPATATRTRSVHLDPSVLSMPSLAISNAAREALHQVDVVESMLIGILTVILRLGMSVFINGNVHDAKKLLE